VLALKLACAAGSRLHQHSLAGPHEQRSVVDWELLTHDILRHLLVSMISAQRVHPSCDSIQGTATYSKPSAAGVWAARRKARARAMIDFEAGTAPEEALRQATASAITLKAAPARAATLLPEDLHYEARMRGRCLWLLWLRLPAHA